MPVILDVNAPEARPLLAMLPLELDGDVAGQGDGRDGSPAGPERVAEADPSLVERARRGDSQAFVDVVAAYDDRLRALAFRLLGDRDSMDDALQEAYVKAFRSLHRFRGDSDFGTWLYRITYNVCLDELRRRRPVTELSANGSDPEAPGPDPADAAVASGDLAAALRALPPDHRAAVLLVDAHGFDYAEAGRALGVPAGTVASRLNRARRTLRRALSMEPS